MTYVPTTKSQLPIAGGGYRCVFSALSAALLRDLRGQKNFAHGSAPKERSSVPSAVKITLSPAT